MPDQSSPPPALLVKGLEPPERFLDKNNVFVIFTVSPKDDDEGFKTYRSVKKLGYKVFGMGAKKETFNGDQIYLSLDELPEKPNVVYIATKSDRTKKFVEDCIANEIEKIWFRPSTETSELMEFCRRNSMEIMTHRDLARGLENERAYC